MAASNRYGLSRVIPEGVKRTVRQRCGFGCIHCGVSLVEYHHFDPPFNKAKMHDPLGITLLCPTCHNDETISPELIVEENKNPFCKRVGSSNRVINSISASPIIMIGDATYTNNPIIIKVHGKPLLYVEEPEVSGAPYRINALFYDKMGLEIARIVKNEWISYINNWDIDNPKGKFIIRHAHRDLALVVRYETNKLFIERLNMFYRGYHFIVREGALATYGPTGELLYKIMPGACLDNNGVVFCIK